MAQSVFVNTKLSRDAKCVALVFHLRPFARVPQRFAEIFVKDCTAPVAVRGEPFQQILRQVDLALPVRLRDCSRNDDVAAVEVDALPD